MKESSENRLISALPFLCFASRRIENRERLGCVYEGRRIEVVGLVRAKATRDLRPLRHSNGGLRIGRRAQHAVATVRNCVRDRQRALGSTNEIFSEDDPSLLSLDKAPPREKKKQ